MARVKYVNFAVGSTGAVISGASVEVRDSAGNLATLYAGETGTTLAYSGTNPFSAGDGVSARVGYFEFFAEPDVYNITVGTGASATTYEVSLLFSAKVSHASRSALKTAVTNGLTWDDGTIISDGTVQYVASAGATAISDLPGLLPHGIIRYEHFGAIGDGVTNDQAAVSAALAYGPVEAFDKTYLCSSTVSLTTAVNLSGGTLLFSNLTGGGILVTLNNDAKVFIRDCKVLTNQKENGDGIRVTRDTYSGVVDRNQQNTRILRVRVSGQDYFSQGWTRGIVIDECSAAEIAENQVVGRRDQLGTGATEFWPGMTEAILHTSTTDKQPVDPKIVGNRISYAEFGIKNTGVSEGLLVKDNFIVACKWGYYDDRTEIVSTTKTNDPLLWFVNNHANTSRAGVYTTRVFQSFIERNLLYQFTQQDDVYVGIEHSVGNDVHVLNNSILCNSASANVTTGVLLKSTNRSQVLNNKVITATKLVEFDGSGLGISDCIAEGNTGTDKSGNELTPVSYVNAASKTSNTYAINRGVVAQGENGASVTVLSTLTDITSFSLDSAPVGAKFRVTSNVLFTKGATAGKTEIIFRKGAGTGGATFLNSAGNAKVINDSQAASSVWQVNGCFIFEKTTAGTLLIAISGISSGSDSTVGAAACQYVVERIA